VIKNFKQFAFIALLLTIAGGVQPAWTAIWQWSTTAATNSNADPSINWSEGMSPSSVNDSARAMMAALAAWRNDISATNTTGGTASAYTLTTSEGVSSTPSNGQMLAFIAHAGNNASATMQVDGGNTYPIWLNGSVLGGGSLVAGSPYRMAFSASNSAWVLESGPANPYNVALGALMFSTANAPPNSNFIVPQGQCISTTTYAAYWASQGSPASGSCPGGQFAVIDMRGMVPALLDTPFGGTAANRLTSSSTGCGSAMTSIGASCANGNQATTLSTLNLPPYTPSGSVSTSLSLVGSVTAVINAGGGGVGGGGAFGPSATIAVNFTGSSASSSFSGSAQGGTSTPFSRVQPTVAVNVFLRVI
jgi:hypothetical protein